MAGTSIRCGTASGSISFRDSGFFEERRNGPGCPSCRLNRSTDKKVLLKFSPARDHPGSLHLPLEEDRLQTIGEDIGTSWKEVGQKLGIKFTELDIIDQERTNHSVKDKVMAMLMLWSRLNGTEATVARLAHALIAAGRKDVADKLKGGDSRILQLTIQGSYEPQGEVCWYVCSSTRGEKTYLVAEIDKSSVVIEDDTLVTQAARLWDELKDLQIPFTIPKGTSISGQLLECENIQNCLQSFDVQLQSLTAKAGHSSNSEKPEILPTIAGLKDCSMKLGTENRALSNRIKMLCSEESMDAAQRRQLEILQANQKGTSLKMEATERVLDILMEQPGGDRKSAPASLLQFAEHMYPEKICRFLSEAMESMRLRTAGRFDTRL